ncbi:hypothetical protein DASC09_046110 [Saccharomycopsis crataegensis]|uniref:Mannosyltransferase KTR4 n=1 Tax=Saccharomycopsis crataegensis TaxID=43959 RepID=A0AAV5QRC9_9ASCO|nr:hypothetical protein DASC09_046110 [Saccharomycopsis crataegensis]
MEYVNRDKIQDITNKVLHVLVGIQLLFVSMIRRKTAKLLMGVFVISFLLINLPQKNYEQIVGKENVHYIKDYYNTWNIRPNDEFNAPTLPYDVDLSKEKTVNPKYKEQSLFNSDHSVNMKYFKTFKYHEDDITPKAILERNDALYEKVMSHKINEPRVDNLQRPDVNYRRANATLMSLVRNSEIDGLVDSMRQVEAHFNKKFRYPWTLMNNRPFEEEFKRRVLAETDAQVNFVVIPPELWDIPPSIDIEKMNAGMKKLADQDLPYATLASYRNMCRFNSGTFYNVPEMQQYRWYWRVEPSVNYFCDIDYDVFKFMEDNGKTYGFVATLYEIAETIPTLWSTSLEFVKENPQYLNPNGAFDWLLNDNQLPDKAKLAKGYSTCHFWSNFEIGDMDFYRGEAYSKWFDHLEKAGGFYYERWGDAPVHSVGLGLFADKSKIHWFRDMGYHHPPYYHCPTSDKCSGCTAGLFTPHENILDQNCNPHWIRFSMTEKDLELY